MLNYDDPLKKKQAAYEMASRAELTNYMAKIRFKRMPYYMPFLESWTTGKEVDYESDGTEGVDGYCFGNDE